MYMYITNKEVSSVACYSSKGDKNTKLPFLKTHKSIINNHRHDEEKPRRPKKQQHRTLNRKLNNLTSPIQHHQKPGYHEFWKFEEIMHLCFKIK